MYLRYRAKYYNETKDQIEYGVFWAADYLQKSGKLPNETQAKLDKLIHFFDYNLPIPDYYQKEKNRQKAKSATSWFKDTAKKYITPMNEMVAILEAENVEVERINSKKVLGKKIYEDEYQITVIPYRDVAKQVL